MNNDLISLLERFFSGATSAEEERILTEWLRDKSESDPELAEYYRSKWAATNGSMDSQTKARIHARIRETIDGNAPEAPAPRPRLLGRLIPWAAAACIAVAAFAGWYNYAKVTARQGHLFEIYTEKGQKTNITLPDGTRVWLNSASRLSYDNRYNLRSREVNLVGEGYFEVAKDPERRFRVNTGNYTVEALGTAFNVKSYPEDRTSVTTLFEGKVRIDDGDGFTTTLDPMEAVAYDTADGGFTKSVSGRTPVRRTVAQQRTDRRKRHDARETHRTARPRIQHPLRVPLGTHPGTCVSRVSSRTTTCRTCSSSSDCPAR